MGYFFGRKKNPESVAYRVYAASYKKRKFFAKSECASAKHRKLYQVVVVITQCANLTGKSRIYEMQFCPFIYNEEMRIQRRVAS